MRSIAVAAIVLLGGFQRTGAVEDVRSPALYSETILQKCDDTLHGVLDSAGDDTIAVWIFFGGGRRSLARRHAAEEPGEFVSARAVRRLERRAPRNVAKYRPPDRECLTRISEDIVRIRRVSRYFNAVSADIAVDRIPAVCAHDFVKRLSRVAVYRRGRDPCRDRRMDDAARSPDDGTSRPVDAPRRTAIAAHLPTDDPVIGTYGGSFDQLDQIQAISLLEMGYNGSGAVSGGSPVLICMLDTGFNLDHEALDHVRVEAEYDFVQNDAVTSDQEGDFPNQERHGTIVLGAVAGYHEGDLIGPAWGAEYLLAKTEIEGQEIRIEEDNWIAAIEWADSAGADVVSSSLGYIDWYDPEDRDGDTALITRAADIAVSRGIVVVNAAGNEGEYGGLTPPADGDSVIAVGAVYRDGRITSFSSRGPTADGRIKPDLVAMGYRVQSVAHGTYDGYGAHNGTSLAAPLVAGLCALILEIHPDWSPISVRDSLTATATRSSFPDNAYGYGLPRGPAAAGFASDGPSRSAVFTVGYPNPFRETILFDLILPKAEPVTARIYDCRGALIRTLLVNRVLKWRWSLMWDGTNNEGRRVAAGVYLLVVTSLSTTRTTKVLLLP